MSSTDLQLISPVPAPIEPGSRRAHIAELGSRVLRVREAMELGEVALCVRVSSWKQFRESKGSLDFQHRQIRYLEPFGIVPSAVKTYVSVESAQGTDDRPDFALLLRRIEAGQVRLVIAAFADRMSRNWPQFQQLGDALEKVKGILFLEGEMHDFASSRGRREYRDAASQAVYQSEQRVQRNLVTLCGKARTLSLAYNLPVGYCWASLEDPVYIRAIDEQHMRDALGAAPEGHLTNVTRSGRRYLVLPYPDQAVYSSMILRRDLLLQSHDLRAVLEVIHTDSVWPFKHHWPVRHSGNRFSLSDPVTWRDLRTYRSREHSDQLRNLVGRWYLSSTLYGAYEWQLADDVELDEHLKAFGAKINVPNASPDSLFRPDQRALVRGIIGKRDQRQWSVSTDLEAADALKPRPLAEWRRLGFEPVLPEVRCAVAWRDEDVCNGKLFPTARASAPRLRYVPVQCRSRHAIRTSLSEEAEDLIVQTVFDTLEPTVFAEAVSRIQLKQSVEKGRLSAVVREMQDLDKHLAFLRRELEKAQVKGPQGLTKQLLKALGEAGERFEQKKRMRDEAEAGLAIERELSDQDRTRIRELASRLPDLWTRCEGIAGARAALMRVLIKRVYVRRIGTRMDHVEIEFPSGMRIARILYVAPVPMASGWRQWCLERLRAQLEGDRLLAFSKDDLAEAECVADELNQLVRRRNITRKWRGSDVRAAAILAMYEPTALASPGAAAESLDAIAEHTNLAVDELKAHAKKGHLGEPSFAGGELRYRPTDVQLCRWFPEYARREVSRAMGWPLEDTWSLTEAAARHGVRRRILVLYVNNHHLTVPDASRRPWLSASALSATIPPLLKEAVRALNLPHMTEADFVTASEAEQAIMRLTGRRVSRGWHTNGRRRGYMLLVRARRAGCLHEECVHVYLPKRIRECADRAIVVKWLDGRAPELTAWSPKPRIRGWDTRKTL